MERMVRVKICGITRREDAEEAVRAGADYLGLNFWLGSQRAVRAADAATLIPDRVPAERRVGVFVNAQIEQIEQVVRIAGLGLVQLHGEEKPEFCRRLKARLPRIQIIKAFRIRAETDLEWITLYDTDFVLLDAWDAGSPGGTGKKFDHSVLGTAKLPMQRVFIAGGITPDNVDELLSVCRPYGIDVATGVERSPGVKDPEKIRKLIAKVRSHAGT